MTTSIISNVTTYAQYKDDDDPDGLHFHAAKREGAITGFEACRDKTPEAIRLKGGLR